MDLLKPTLQEQIAEVEREIELRNKVYPRWIEKKRLTQRRADRLIEIMWAVRNTLKELEK